MIPIVREVTIGPCRLIQGDCAEVLPLIGRVDAVVTDPPYGVESHLPNTTFARANTGSRGKLAQATEWGYLAWDKSPPSQNLLDAIVATAKGSIVWGGNYFHFAPSAGWLVWDKQNSGDFADCELAWTNLRQSVRKIAWMWNGMIRKGNETRVHPTQKPTGVIEWCLGFLPEAKTILDPFMGSGTTGVACIRTGRQFIGIEKEPKYFDIAVKRIQQAWDLKCSELPFEVIEQPKQAKLFEVEGVK